MKFYGNSLCAMETGTCCLWLVFDWLIVCHYRSYNWRTSWWNINRGVWTISVEVDEWLENHWCASAACCWSHRVPVHLLARSRQPNSSGTRIHQCLYKIVAKVSVDVVLLISRVSFLTYPTLLWLISVLFRFWFSLMCCFQFTWLKFQFQF